MKKILFVLCCIVCIASLLCFSACDSAVVEETSTAADETISSDSTDNTSDSSTVENPGAVLSLASDTTEVSPGEKFTVNCTVNRAELFAACDLLVAFDENQVEAEVVAQNVKDLYAFGEDHKSGYLYSAYVLYTLDMKDTVIFTIECVASENCSSGDEIKISLICEDWLIGTDESGDELSNITDSVVTNSLTVKVR